MVKMGNHQSDICAIEHLFKYLFTFKELLDEQYLSCYRPVFDQILKVGSWEHQEQILTVRLTFVQATFVLETFVHVGNIYTLNIINIQNLFKLNTSDLNLV